MQRADEMPIVTAPVEYRTPRKAFETYWNSVKRGDASEFACMTTACVARILQTDVPPTPEQLQRIAAGGVRLMERNFIIVGFKYVSDMQKPKIEFYFTLDRTIESQTIHFKFLERVVLVRANDGWKIDSAEQEETD